MDTGIAQNTFRKPGLGALVVSALLFLFLFRVSYPYFRYYIDPDAVAYLTIARRYATGDILRAVNGLWSPFHPFIVSLFIRCGFDALFAAHITNAMACVGIITGMFFMFRRFRIDAPIANALMIALPVFLVYCQYAQLFDDLWQIVFLLGYLLIICSRHFLTTWWKWVICGIIGAFAFFAKTYSFYFIVLHLAATIMLLNKAQGRPLSAHLRTYIAVLVTMLVIMAPWIYMLHLKYGGWALSNAGSINGSCTVTGHKTFKQGINHLIPPAYPDSPYSMEDPSINEGHLYSLWQSPQLFLLQCLRSSYALMQAFFTMGQLSFFMVGLLAATGIAMYSKKVQHIFQTDHKILFAASLIIPIGYMLMHFEPRYIWLMVYTSMILGATWLMLLKKHLTPGPYYLLVVLFAVSYIAYPLYDMKILLNKGKDIYTEAQQVNKLHLHGTFTSNESENRCPVTAMLTHMPYYTIEHFNFSHQVLLAEMRRYRVNYYFFYCKPSDARSVQLRDERNIPFPEVTKGNIPNLLIFQVNP
jgi:hypothetical protein